VRLGFVEGLNNKIRVIRRRSDSTEEACGKCGHQKADAHTSHRLGDECKRGLQKTQVGHSIRAEVVNFSRGSKSVG
jgi:hypothetical protein